MLALIEVFLAGIPVCRGMYFKIFKLAVFFYRFNIQLDFRTYYKNGLLLYLSNKAQSSFFAAQLRRGTIVLTYENRGKVKEVKVNPALAVTDGKWHTVQIRKNNKRVVLKVDDADANSGRIAKKMKVDVSLFVGGLPSSYLNLVNEKVVCFLCFLQHLISSCLFQIPQGNLSL